jgi:superfamily II DNA/RNA helicase
MTNRTLAGTHAGASEVSLSDTSSPLPGQGQGGTPLENPRFESAPAGDLENPGFNSATIFPAVPESGGEGSGDSDFNNQDAGGATQTPTNSGSAPNGFEALGLSPLILKAVAESGYTTPTPIQAQGIPEVLKRRDIIGIAQTGTGKTASFTLPMIELLARGRAKARMPRSLILEPTRELAAQVAESFERYGKHNKLSMALLIGGTSFDDQEKKLDRGVDVLIATPGRLLDHFERGKLMLSQVQILVIDEADRMLDMGFIPDVERICKLIPFTRQTLFYSATMPPEIQRLTDQFLHHPVRVEVSRPATTADNIVQEAIDIPASDWAKREALRRLIRDNGVKNAIVFCNRKRDVDVVAKSLSKHGFNAAPLHGDLDQSVRTRTLDGFRSGAIQFLVASDVAARGLDIPAVSHIFNFDAPYHADDYVHRIGRTGRAGRSGHAYMLVTPRDAKYVEAIERLTGNKLVRRSLEGLADAVEARPHEERGRDRHRGGRSHKPHSGRHEHKGSHAPRAPQHSHSSHAPQQHQAQPHAPVQHGHAHAPKPVQSHAHEAKPQTAHHGKPHGAQASHAPQQHKHKPDAQQRERDKQFRPQPPGSDAEKLPAFLLRPIPMPKEKPAPAPRKKVPA